MHLIAMPVSGSPPTTVARPAVPPPDAPDARATTELLCPTEHDRPLLGLSGGYVSTADTPLAALTPLLAADILFLERCGEVIRFLSLGTALWNPWDACVHRCCDLCILLREVTLLSIQYAVIARRE